MRTLFPDPGPVSHRLQYSSAYHTASDGKLGQGLGTRLVRTPSCIHLLTQFGAGTEMLWICKQREFIFLGDAAYLWVLSGNETIIEG